MGLAKYILKEDILPVHIVCSQKYAEFCKSLGVGT